ncbi:GNAT family N-acetyltransferase [Paraburkholderia sp. SARCC-3016]|uniref:GNAT family N-acetyltransferase n=1 Tax=Paraburkholderia sp. SARCC-3016 TaxID=3058611 RepID=UPI0028094C3E|nr:GNAT family N-acetyltransferase [Paraburkholderia sp. SARCC-3016]MDQ7979047.1 GNAT family N-acetyltransferase [Paraburkholderia sp. SARCC-3016]
MKRSALLDKRIWTESPERFYALEGMARENLEGLSLLYPNFLHWYESKVVPGLLTGERKILLREAGGRLAGLAIVKDTEDEKKLCCLRVMPDFKGSGIGLKLFDESFELLKSDKPLLTIAEEQLPQFGKIFEHFGFEVGDKYQDIYRRNKAEYSYNGLLLQYEDNIEKI